MDLKYQEKLAWDKAKEKAKSKEKPIKWLEDYVSPHDHVDNELMGDLNLDLVKDFILRPPSAKWIKSVICKEICKVHAKTDRDNIKAKDIT